MGINTIITAPQLEDAVIDTLQFWMETYLNEVERQAGIDELSFARPRSYITTVEPDNWPEDQLPAIIVVAPGLDEEPEKTGEGYYHGWWLISVVAIVATPEEKSSRRLAQFYAATIRAIILQNKGLGGIASQIDWLNESYRGAADDVERNRSLGAGIVDFRVRVDELVNERGGPLVPSNPWPAEGTVLDTELILNKLP